MTRPHAVHRPKPPLPRMEVYKDRAGRFRYRRRAKNTKIVATAGQSYAYRRGAREAAKRDHPGIVVLSWPLTRWDWRAQ